MKEEEAYQTGFNTGGHLSEESVAGYADWLTQSGPEPSGEIREHVAQCRLCRSEIMETADIVDEIEKLGLHSESAEPGKSRWIQWTPTLRIAASVAAVFVLAILIQKFWPETQPKDPMAGVVDSTQIQKDSLDAQPADSLSDPSIEKPAAGTHDRPVELAIQPDTVKYAQNFEPLPMYESLIGAVFRASGDPQVQAPAIGKVVQPGDTLRFTWTPNTQEKFMVQILTNRDEKVSLLAPVQPGIIEWVAPQQPGLYYWKFEGEDRMYTIGKVKVMRKK